MDLNPGDIALVLGGARSGKSAYAERLIETSGLKAVYLATTDPVQAADDAEMADRIAHHRSRRGPTWTTIEEPLDVAERIEAQREDNAVLVDCLTLWLSNLMHAGRDVAIETRHLADAISTSAAAVVLVSNEVRTGIVPENALARRFRDEAGRMHQIIADAATHVTLVAAGLPLALKRAGSPVHD